MIFAARSLAVVGVAVLMAWQAAAAQQSEATVGEASRGGSAGFRLRGC